jgi:hypothetical protein
MLRHFTLAGILLAIFAIRASAQQHSIARRWNEALLQGIREDFARPPVQARNLFHTSLALYDAWAAYDTIAETYLLGKTVGNYTCAFNGIPAPANIKAAQEQAMSHAFYRVVEARFLFSPNAFTTLIRFFDLMKAMGYDPDFTSTDYSTGNPAALGNYIGQQILQMGMQDGSNELGNYSIQYYQSVNPALVMANPGNPFLLDPNRWQRLTLNNAIDQNGNPIPATQVFQSPEWGNVQPFALSGSDLTVFQRDGHQYKVYHDPGPFPMLDTANGGAMSDEYKWNFELVPIWQAHHDPNDGVMWDISPRNIGNVTHYPQSVAEYHDFYNLLDGGDTGMGRDTNPRTGLPYEPQMVPRGDYTRVLAQYWADGPSSETPPGHWFAIMNKTMDHPAYLRKFNGKGEVLDTLEWDVKAYFTLGGAVHDAAISAWGIKGWYDGVRPVSALRYMAGLGQSSDPALPSYHKNGVRLLPGYIELVQAGDPLAGPNNANVGKIKFYTWRGPDYVTQPLNQIAGVGWILGENWWPYQRKTFVTPPFAGYISGHSTYSRAAAEALTLLTGDEYFPGGMGEFHIAANSNFLGLEKGPSVDITLQWATYRDASDQTSLSRIWGGIHPPMDDIPGRVIGAKAGIGAFNKAKTYFYRDADGDGAFSYEDCDDNDPTRYPGAAELCDGIDNDCNGLTDDLPVFTFFADTDGDGFGNALASLDTCQNSAPSGFVADNTDCDDNDPTRYPGAAELCDGIDNNCDGLTDDLPVFTFFADNDGDGFGNALASLDTCQNNAPAGFVADNTDCDDNDPARNPGATELCDGIDNNCDGLTDDLTVFTFFADTDGDGFGNALASLDTCQNNAPAGFVTDNTDCDDNDPARNPGATELCDGIDNNCDGKTDDLPVFTFFADTDGDGFGNALASLDTCQNNAPTGFVTDNTDCDDTNGQVNPDAQEIIDGIDNNCDGKVDDVVRSTEPGLDQVKVYPNPVSEWLRIVNPSKLPLLVRIRDVSGRLLYERTDDLPDNTITVDCTGLNAGLYFLHLHDNASGRNLMVKFVKTGR